MLSRRTPFVNCQQRSAQSMRLAALPRSASAGQQAPLALSAGILAALLFNPVQPAAAFGPVSIKLDNIQIERIDCGGACRRCCEATNLFCSSALLHGESGRSTALHPPELFAVTITILLCSWYLHHPRRHVQR